jgi:drug/metabolite transporter (DMT)-like permease
VDISVVIFITLVAALMASFAQIMYKRGLTVKLRSVADFVALLRNKLVVAGLIVYILSLVIYLYGLSAAPLSVVYPTFASTFIFVTVISAVLLKEHINWKRALGILLIFLGVLIIAVSAL